jgi:uncharacterized protein YbaP (TraB family)
VRAFALAVLLLTACRTARPAAAGPEPASPTLTCPPPVPQPQQERLAELLKGAHDRGFLWAFGRDGHASFLYGTLHVADPERAMPGPTVLAAFKKADTVVLELDPLHPDAAGMREAFARIAFTPSPALADRFTTLARGECLDGATLSKMPPALVPLTIMMQRAKRDGLFGDWAIDTFIAGMAQGAKKPLVALETPQEQFDALFGSPKEAQESAEKLAEALETEPQEGTRHLRALFDAWSAGDLDAIALATSTMEHSDSPATRAMHDRLFSERNVRMADRIEALHKDKTLFVAVGSGHMTGATGLPTLLEQRGFKVVRVTFVKPAK